MIVRPIRQDDLEDLFDIARESGPGFTSLMPDRDLLSDKIDASIRSFRAEPTGQSEQRYLFVLEDAASGQVLGTTGMTAGAGQRQPLQHFLHSQRLSHSRDPGLHRSAGTLTRGEYYQNCTELCSLFLRPAFRRAHAGKLLSKVRFAFMAQHPERFPRQTIAQMRGVTDAQGQSPFWNWLRNHVVDMDFSQVTQLAGTGALGLVEDLMPSLPLSTHLMSPSARAVIGRVHADTEPALALLKAEGFQHRGLVDLFDAGPTVECQADRIRSVQESASLRVEIRPGKSGPSPDDNRLTLVANTQLETFRAILVSVCDDDLANQRIGLSGYQAEVLGLADGAPARALCLNRAATTPFTAHNANTLEATYAL